MAKLTKNGVPRGNVLVENETLLLDTYRSVDVTVSRADKRGKVLDCQTIKVTWRETEDGRPSITVT